MMAATSAAEGVSERPRIVLVAPNISSRMGGEALKALQIHLEFNALGIDVYQVTHGRVRAEIERDHPDLNVTYVADGFVQVLLHRAHLSLPLLLLNAWQLHRSAQRVAITTDAWLVHFTSPISPVMPYFAMRGYPVIIGPLNGNIFHPPAFAERETLGKALGKRFLVPVQKLSGYLFAGKKRAMILAAGGDRTVVALTLGGCSIDRIIPTLDSGIPALLAEAPRLTHQGLNTRFVFAGRLIRYKGCDLAIRAIALADAAVTLDIIGDGPERRNLERLVDSLGLRDRITFVGWVEAGRPLFDHLRRYRGFVMPTLAEANGIGVQEAMMLGLPVICVDWGGPATLLTPETGVLIAPHGEDYVIGEIARAMAYLAAEADEAESLSAQARRQAMICGFTWRPMLLDWLKTYDRALAEIGSRSIASWVSAHKPQAD
jgi:glycosyltransferase involved in cell wall biosynthesis